MAKQICHPMKIHFPGCKCKHYRDKISNPNHILVSPYIKRNFNEKYYVYDSIISFNKDKHIFVNNCLCTHSDGVYNGGIVLLSLSQTNNIQFSESNELTNLQFTKLEHIQHVEDNSNLINEFCKLFPSFLYLYTLIGETITFYNEEESKVNHTFPKGKISIGESVVECCYREFFEETNCTLDKNIINPEYQLNIRKSLNIDVLPLNIIINNFFLILIVI